MVGGGSEGEWDMREMRADRRQHTPEGEQDQTAAVGKERVGARVTGEERQVLRG